MMEEHNMRIKIDSLIARDLSASLCELKRNEAQYWKI
jgi:hypothetical protein